MSVDRKQLGAAGEKAAEKYLRSQGYRILARNYACPVGELDLICYHDRCIVFVEVKTLASSDAGDPEDRITPAKQRQLARVARAWLAAHREPDCAYRFDAVSVVMSAEGVPGIRHILEAFIPDRG